MVSNVAVAAYDSDLEVEHDVKTLQRGGFDMTRVCVIGRDYGTAEHTVAFLHPGRRARFFGSHGVLWNTLSGILFGAALVYLPVAEHVVILGPLATYLTGAMQAPAPAGASPLATALNALGIPKGAAGVYDTAVRTRQVLLIVHADTRGIQRARQILEQAHFETFGRA